MEIRPESNEQRWYPTEGKGLNYEQANAHRITLDMVYDLKSQLRDLHGKHEEMKTHMAGMKKENERLKEVINNRIAGRLVKPRDPKNGETIRYDSQEGQFVFGP